MGLDLVLGYDGFRTVCYVERDAYAAATIVARMADQTLGEAPIWDDVFSFDPRPWRGKVDLVSAGFPCQPFSQAGKRRAESDERHLFPRIAEIIREVGPRIVFLENVRGLLTASGGRVFGNVLGTLADLGFSTEYLCLKASDVGASHRRERVFILAHAANERHQWTGHTRERGAGFADDGVDLAHRDGAGFYRLAEPNREPEPGREKGKQRGHPDGYDLAGIPAFPPGPDDRDAWARVLAERPDLAPALADGERERLEGDRAPGAAALSTGRGGGTKVVEREGEAQSKLCGVAHGLSARVDACRKERLRACGNGVVPLQAAVAFVVLARRAGLMK